MQNNTKQAALLLLLSLATVLAGPGRGLTTQAGEQIRHGEMAGYLIVRNERQSAARLGGRIRTHRHAAGGERIAKKSAVRPRSHTGFASFEQQLSSVSC
jgi:hypothetical protein